MPLDTTQIIVAIIGVISVVLSGSIPYYLTKNKEIEYKIKEKKLERYDELIDKFTKYLRYPSDEKITSEFIDGYHKASAYASTDVLKACHAVITAMGKEVPKSKAPSERSDNLVSGIYNAIRKDVSPKEPDYHFESYL